MFRRCPLPTLIFNAQNWMRLPARKSARVPRNPGCYGRRTGPGGAHRHLPALSSFAGVLPAFAENHGNDPPDPNYVANVQNVLPARRRSMCRTSRFAAQDMVAGAALVLVGTVLLVVKLNVLNIDSLLAGLHDVVRWWPLLLIALGFGLLLPQGVPGAPYPER